MVSPQTDQTEGKKEEGGRGWLVYISLGFLIGYFRRTQYITSMGLFYKKVGILLGVRVIKWDDGVILCKVYLEVIPFIFNKVSSLFWTQF